MIQELYAYVYWDDQDGEEKILGWQAHPNALFPCVGPDLENVKVLGQLALPAAIRAGKEVALVKFSTREVLFSRGSLEAPHSWT